ncbi:MAG: DNA-directed polymerase [Pedosphaera sp.]|nr:DNA-directed polymerase [Pedosphaera sp.]
MTFLALYEYKTAMSFADFPEQKQGVQLLQRSLERGRLAHAYLFGGHHLAELEALARTLAKTLNCQNPKRATANGPAIDCCDECAVCRKIDAENHGDVHWVRPESKSRVVTIDQMRDLMHEIHLKPNEAEYKVATIVAADRLNVQAANAFLKTLEEPPPKSILILLTTEPQRILETIISRCLRLNFAGEGTRKLATAQLEWLTAFGEMAAAEQKSLLGRYRLLGVLLKRLGELKGDIEKALTARSPLERYDDLDPKLREKWEDELAASIEAEYRLQRSDLLALLQWWLRDVWMQTMGLNGGELLSFPQISSAGAVAKRISSEQAIKNLQVLERMQRLLGSNVQEALALEVGLLELSL